MNKNLKDEITEILDKSGLVDIHLAHGLIIQPIIEYIKNNLPKEKDTSGIQNKYMVEDNKTYNQCLAELKKGLGI